MPNNVPTEKNEARLLRSPRLVAHHWAHWRLFVKDIWLEQRLGRCYRCFLFPEHKNGPPLSNALAYKYLCFIWRNLGTKAGSCVWDLTGMMAGEPPEWCRHVISIKNVKGKISKKAKKRPVQIRRCRSFLWEWVEMAEGQRHRTVCSLSTLVQRVCRDHPTSNSTP